MDCRTGDILPYKDMSESQRAHAVPLNDADVPKAHKMNKDQRKNWMRNKPCVCGSGKKFKKCCWFKFAGK